MNTYSLIIAVVALLISLWGRVEVFYGVKRQKKIDIAKKVGEALISCQQLKNKLSFLIDLGESFLKTHSNNMYDKNGLEKVQKIVEGLHSEFKDIGEFLIAFELITMSGKSSQIDPLIPV